MRDTADSSPLDDSPSKLKSRWRISLSTFFLLTALGLAIMANYLQYRGFQTTKQYMWARHTEMADDLNATLGYQEVFDQFEQDDPQRIQVSLVPGNSAKEWLWQIATPENEAFKIHISDKGIQADGVASQPLCSYTIERSTWLKVKLKNGAYVACQSDRRAFSPIRPRGWDPMTWRSDVPIGAQVWNIAGRNCRESFDPAEPVILLRMRETPPPSESGANADRDAPGLGLLVWIEKPKN
jgi:hypothetical protein